MVGFKENILNVGLANGIKHTYSFELSILDRQRKSEIEDSKSTAGSYPVFNTRTCIRYTMYNDNIHL